MLMGKGFAFWKTMPTRRRRSVSCISFEKISSPRSRTPPSMRTFGTRSFIRFRVLRKVDLPQPEGPMRAVISCSPTSSEMPLRALKSPYQRFRFFAEMTGILFSIKYPLLFLFELCFCQTGCEVDEKHQDQQHCADAPGGGEVAVLEGPQIEQDGEGRAVGCVSLGDAARNNFRRTGGDLAIIPGVITICTLVMMLTNGASADGTYTGAAYEGIAFLPWLGKKLEFILSPLFGFTDASGISVPITALGAAGAAIGLVPHMAEAGTVLANDVAVFTAMCMCWSGYLSTHVAMMSSLKVNKLTGKAILSHTIGGLCAGVAANWIFKLVMLFL